MSRRALILAVLAGLPASCGYSTRLAPEKAYRSVGVEYFHNKSDLRDLEAPLQEELSRAVNELVRAPLAAPRRSDLVIRGEIVEYARRGGIRNTRNQLQESGVRLQVRARLYDAAGREVGEEVEAAVDVGYIVGDGALDLSTPDTTRRNRVLELTNEAAARAQALRHVSERLVLDLFGPMN